MFCLQGLHYLVLISEVEDVEVFKICLECWYGLVSNLYEKHCDLYNENHYDPIAPPFMFPSRQNNFMAPRRQFYAPVLSKVSIS